MRIGSSLLILTLAVSASAEIYRSTNEAGNPEFTDQPQPGADTVELPAVNTVEPVTPRPSSAPPAESGSQRQGYNAVVLEVPQIVPNGLAPVTVTLETEPPLRDGHRWRLLLDGALVAESANPLHTFPRLERGPHRIGAEIVDARGEVVAEADEREIFVYWPGGNR